MNRAAGSNSINVLTLAVLYNCHTNLESHNVQLLQLFTSKTKALYTHLVWFL